MEHSSKSQLRNHLLNGGFEYEEAVLVQQIQPNQPLANSQINPQANMPNHPSVQSNNYPQNHPQNQPQMNQLPPNQLQNQFQPNQPVNYPQNNYSQGQHQNQHPQNLPQNQFQHNQSGPYPKQPYNASYDVLAVPAPSNSNSRKASLTSQSGLNRLFMRNKSQVDNFNEDAGADIGELTHGANLSLHDITHIRDRGKYAMNSNNRIEDTTPIIPTIGLGDGKPSTNINYRKQMNQQMKLAYSMGARAKSMNNQQNPMTGPNDRTMSFNSFGSQGPRTMSLMSNRNQPRTMSMNNNGYPGPNAPRTMSINNLQYPPNNGSRPRPNAPYGPPRTMSLNNQLGPPPTNGNYGYPHYQNNQQPPNGMYQQYPPKQMQYQQPGVHGSNANYQRQPQPYQGADGQFPLSGSYEQLPNRSGDMGQMSSPPQNYSNNSPVGNSLSNDSLTNVIEEEEEDLSRRHTLAPQRKTPPLNPLAMMKAQKSQPESGISETGAKDAETGETESFANNNESKLVNTLDEDDVIYKFDNEKEEDSLSRKSTLKKTNSMRLRKLDLFNRKSEPIEATKEEIEEEVSTPTKNGTPDEKVSPSFNVRHSKTRYSTYTTDNEEDYDNKDNYRTIGASAGNKSNSTSITNDVFVTAPDFNSPLKKSPNRNEDPSKLEYNSDIASRTDTNTYDDTALTIKERASPESSKVGLVSGSDSMNAQKVVSTSEPFENYKTPSADSTPVFHQQEQFAPPPQVLGIESKNSLGSTGYSSDSLKFNQPRDFNYSQDSFDRNSQDTSVYSSHTTSESVLPVDSGKGLPNNFQQNYSLEAENERYGVSQEDVHGGNYVDGRNQQKFVENKAFIHDIPPANHQQREYIPTKPVENYPPAVSTGHQQDFLQNKNIDTYIPTAEAASVDSKSKRSSINSISAKSKNLFKRFSKRKSTQNSENDNLNDTSSMKLSRNSYQAIVNDNNSGHRDISSSSAMLNHSYAPPPTMQYKPLHFTKEELGIMNCNNDLVTELELVTTELASSIKRELSLENKLKNNSQGTNQSNLNSEFELTAKAKTIIDLQEKLNKERRLRFISEEHALMLEHGQEPSALKINYEKNEIYKQLLIKNDLVNQLEDKLAELENKNKPGDQNLLDKYNELLKENTDLKFRIIPELERKFRDTETRKVTSMNKSMSLVTNNSFDQSYDESQEEIVTLKSQREELRETVSKLTMVHNYELNQASDRIRMLEQKLQNLKSINDKLSKRSNIDIDQETSPNRDAPGYNRDYSSNSHGVGSMNKIPVNNKGGKLQGFSIVTPNNRLFD